MQNIITKTTQDGRTLTIALAADGQFVAAVNGAEILRTFGAGTYIPAKRLHVLGGKVGITREEGQQLIAAHQAWMAAGASTEPSRADLIADYRALCDEQQDAYDRAHARQDARAMAIKDSYDARIEAAAAAIEAYDAAHPEETAARRAEQAEAAERNRWM